MNILILGTRGFVGRNISQYCKQSFHKVSNITRDDLDLLDPFAVRKFLQHNSFDVVVNCAATMTDSDKLYDARNNLGIFMNFYNNSNLFGKFINTGSGAEFDRSKNIDNLSEEEIFNCMPTDSYGWGQNIKSRLCAEKDNFFTVRIFNCFGYGEPSTRIFPKFLSKERTVQITDDRYFDYFGIQDLCLLIGDCIKNTWKYKDVNAVYSDKLKISQVLDKFCYLNELGADFKIVSSSSNNYTGNASKINNLNIPLLGLEYCLQHYKRD